jgi:hypothetical protein
MLLPTGQAVSAETAGMICRIIRHAFSAFGGGPGGPVPAGLSCTGWHVRRISEPIAWPRVLGEKFTTSSVRAKTKLSLCAAFAKMNGITDSMRHFWGFMRRLGATLLFRCKQLLRPAPETAVTFCIAHFNSPEFLDATLHAIRRFHPGARIIVADASSEWRQYVAAKSACRRHHAELHPLATRHRHTGLLNYMFRQVRSRVAIYLDQDCVLLDSLDPLIQQIQAGKILVGPRDEFRATHPNLCGRHPG